RLSADYAQLFDRVLDYAREQVTEPSDPASNTGTARVRQRVRWWSALALLRALASSPAAAAATLRTRASAAEATTAEEADELGRAAVLDSADDEALESLDATPGADALEPPPLTDQSASEDALAGEQSERASYLSQRRRLLAMAAAAEALEGPKQDHKLAKL